MKKHLLWGAVAGSIAGLLCLFVFIALTHYGVMQTAKLSYVFIFGYIASTWILFLISLIFKLNISLFTNISIQLFLFLSIAVGSIFRVYDLKPPVYDKIIHFASGILFVFLAFDIFKNNKSNKLSAFWLFMLLFSFSMMIGGVWEIYEYISDGLIGNNAQGALDKVGRDALSDTMLDLICDFVGAFVASLGITVWQSKKQEKAEE